MKTDNTAALETIERRFQFIMILMLFVPSIWDTLEKVSPQFFQSVFGGKMTSIGAVISYVFLSYFLFDVLKKYLKGRYIYTVKILQIVLSYTLILVIAQMFISKGEAIDWQILSAQIVFLVTLFLPVAIFLTIIIGFVHTKWGAQIKCLFVKRNKHD